MSSERKKTNAVLDTVQYDSAYKIAWEAPRFWEKESNIYGGISYLQQAIDLVWYPSARIFSEKGILIGGYSIEFLPAETAAASSLVSSDETTALRPGTVSPSAHSPTCRPSSMPRAAPSNCCIRVMARILRILSISVGDGFLITSARGSASTGTTSGRWLLCNRLIAASTSQATTRATLSVGKRRGALSTSRNQPVRRANPERWLDSTGP